MASWILRSVTSAVRTWLSTMFKRAAEVSSITSPVGWRKGRRRPEGLAARGAYKAAAAPKAMRAVSDIAPASAIC